VKHQQKSLRLLVRSSHLFAKVISSSEEVSGSEETGSKGGRLAGGLAYALGLVCSGCTASRRGELLYKAVWSGSGGLLAEKKSWHEGHSVYIKQHSLDPHQCSFTRQFICRHLRGILSSKVLESKGTPLL